VERKSHSNLIQWAVALGLALVIELPFALTATHHVSHKEGVHIAGAIIAIVIYMLVIRALMFVGVWLYRRAQSGGPAQPRGHATG
jgi:hypothetical protein